MSLSEDSITRTIINQLDGIGIDSRVNGSPSHTANLVKIIVSAIINEIRSSAIVSTTVTTAGSASSHTGTGTGSIT